MIKDIRYYGTDDPPTGAAPAQVQDPAPFDWNEHLPKQEEPPAWAKALIEDNQAIKARLEQATRPPENEEWKYDQEAFAAKIQSEMQANLAPIHHQLQSLTAPAVVENVVRQIGKGLNEAGQQEIRDMLMKQPAGVVQGVLNNPDSVKMLRAVGVEAHRGSGTTPMPTNDKTTVQNPRSDDPNALTSDEDAKARKMFAAFSDVPGFTMEMAQKAAKEEFAAEKTLQDIGRQYVENLENRGGR